MLDGDDRDTWFSLRDLLRIHRAGVPPLLLWVGAGASKWAGLPLWSELARTTHQTYLRRVSQYDAQRANDSIDSGQLAHAFSEYARADRALLNSLLADSLARGKPSTGVYQRFLSGIRGASIRGIITTNVDTLLETQLSYAPIEASDIARTMSSAEIAEGYVLKLHGSIGNVSGTVFTSEEYDRLWRNEGFLDNLRTLLATHTVLFVGYGLRDEYFLRELHRMGRARELFGGGCHFALVDQPRTDLPRSVRQLRYRAEPHADHRTALAVLEELATGRQTISVAQSAGQTEPPPRGQSAHLLADIIPPGTLRTSNHLGLSSHQLAYEGLGLTQAELPHGNATAAHDLAVGLLCFDRVFVPLTDLHLLFRVGPVGFFEDLVRGDILRFLHWTHDPMVIFDASEVAGGKLASVTTFNADGSSRSVSDFLTIQLKPAPERAEEGRATLGLVEKQVVTMDADPIQRALDLDLTRSLLMRPSVRRMLSMSEGISLNSIPRWVAHPVLRAARVVRLGSACRHLGLSSIKLGYGMSTLAQPAFAAVYARQVLDRWVRYLVAGRFNADLNVILEREPDFFRSILRFRDTPEGEALRSDVAGALNTQAGADVSAAIDSGLRRVLTDDVLDKARDRIVELRLSEDAAQCNAIWQPEDADVTRLWRVRVRDQLLAVVKRRNLRDFNQCPCGSGDQLRLCCLAAGNEVT